MPAVMGKCRRTSTEEASPRAAAEKNIFASESPSSSSSQSPSPPRRREMVKSMVLKVIHPRSVAVPNYRGVRYREELCKYVSEIRPTKCSKKIWLGTYDTAKEAARAFDIGNLCCKKNLPLNFADSPSMLKRISSQLSPEETRSAIAKLAKEVARLEVAPIQPEVVQIQHLASAGITSNMYFEQLEENIECTMEVATAMPIGGGGGNGSRSWSFHLNDVILTDDLDDIPPLNVDALNSDQDHYYGDVFYHSLDDDFR